MSTLISRLTPVLLLNFVNVIGFSLLIPVLPEVLKFYTGNSSGIVYGLLLSSYAFSQFIGAPILGSLSDRYGRRPILLLSQLGTLLSWFIFASAYFLPRDLMIGSISVPLLVIALSRITDGITGGNVSVANAWVSDVTTREEKTKAFGLIGATFGVGFLLGPALGGFSVSYSIHFLGTAILAAVISLITLIFIYYKLPESTVHKKQPLDSVSLSEHFNIIGKFNLFRHHPIIKNLFWVRVFYSIAFVGFTTSIILTLSRVYALSPLNIGLIMSVIGTFSIVNQAVVVPKLSEKLGMFNTFFVGLIMSAVALGCHSLLPHLFGNTFQGVVVIIFFLISFPLNLGLSMTLTTFKTIITTHTPDDQQGQATGLDESISSFGQGVTPLFAGALYDVIGFWAFGLYGTALILIGFRAWVRCRNL